MSKLKKAAMTAMVLAVIAVGILIWQDRASISSELYSPEHGVSVYIRYEGTIGLASFASHYRLTAVRWYGIIPLKVTDNEFWFKSRYLDTDDISVQWNRDCSIITVDKCEYGNIRKRFILPIREKRTE